jgi:thioredoxin reductase (NADPH)
MKDVYDILIIGGGPAGLTAALYAGRYARKCCVIGEPGGGMVALASVIENWPGTPKISGIELMNAYRSHAKEYGAVFIDKLAKNVVTEGDLFVVDLGEDKVKGKTVVFGLGTRHRHLQIPGEKELTGKGVSFCATCDGMFFRDKDVVVVGGSDSAATAALFLGEVARSVKIIYRREKLRSEEVYQKRIETADNIEVVFNSIPTEILGKEKVEGIKIKTNDRVSELKCDGVFIEIGANPTNELATSLGVESDDGGYVITDKAAKTNLDSVYAAGDMTNNALKQITTAVSEAAIAANSAHEYLIKMD